MITPIRNYDNSCVNNKFIKRTNSNQNISNSQSVADISFSRLGRTKSVARMTPGILKTAVISLFMLVATGAKATTKATTKVANAIENKIYRVKDTIDPTIAGFKLEGEQVGNMIFSKDGSTHIKTEGKLVRIKKGDAYNDTIRRSDGSYTVIDAKKDGSMTISNFDRNNRIISKTVNRSTGNSNQITFMSDNYSKINIGDVQMGNNSEQESTIVIDNSIHNVRIGVNQSGSHNVQKIVITDSNTQVGNNNTMVIQQGTAQAAKDSASLPKTNADSQPTKTTLKDGTVILKYGNQTITKKPDGTKTLTQPGKTITIKPDGTKIIDQGNGAQRTIIKPDGTRIINKGNKGGQIDEITIDGDAIISKDGK